MRIGICDDKKNEQTQLENLCKQYFEKSGTEYELVKFQSAEEVVDYCKHAKGERIDLLFLDIEMQGMSGIELKDRILKEDAVWRIVFVSHYKEKVFESFGLKTLGFVVKPIGYIEAVKWIEVVREELKEEIYIELKDSPKDWAVPVKLEDVKYAKADGNYTDIYFSVSDEKKADRILVTEKIGKLEKEMEQYPIIRVHKSYLVNLMNVTMMNKCVKIRDLDIEIPIGRQYREAALKKYREFGKEKVRKRL